MSKLFRFGISAALIAWIAWKTDANDWVRVRAAFTEMRVEYWLMAVGVLLLSQFASALRWRYFTDQLRFPRSLRQLTGFYFIGMYFNLMLPTSVGGDVVRACYLDGGAGRRLAAFASVFLDRLNGLMVLVGMACLAVALSPLELAPWIRWSVWGIAAGGLVGLTALPLASRLIRLSPARREQLLAVLRVVRAPAALVQATGLSIVVQVGNVLLVWLVGQAIHAEVPFSFYWILTPMVTLLTLLPISVNGVGVREQATVILLAPFGVGQGSALSLAVLWFAAHATVSVMGGFVYLFGHFPKPELPAEKPGEVTCESIDRDSDQGRARQYSQAA
ncbi:MAG: flippase-like domain-containing protein [Planctomycetes bacterium]|nr:flippase-like domain-containing protein [Planctomycetota bacterium]